MCLFTGASFDANISGFNDLLHYLIGGGLGAGGLVVGGLTWPMCESLYIID